MIQADGLSIAYHGNPLYTNASFTLQKGEKCALVGRNGSGKSTLFRLILGQETSNAGNVVVKRHYSIGALQQQILFTAKTVLEEGVLGLRPEERTMEYYVEKILFGLGFKEEMLKKSPEELSGGFSLRLNLAKVLASKPDCLLLDEPTNYLDIVSIRWLEEFLQQWPGEFIIISHDRSFLDSVSTHTMGIHRQKIKKFSGTTEQYYGQILQEEEVHEKTIVKIEKKKADAQSFIDRFGAKATKAAQAQSRLKQIQRMPSLEKLQKLYSLNFSFKASPFPGRKMVAFDNVDFSYDENPLIQNLNFDVEKNEKIAVVGKNGRGKTTLLKLLAGELLPSSGTIKFSENVDIGYFGQTNISRLDPSLTIEEEVERSNTTATYSEVKAVCGLMMFSGDDAKKKTSVLSGGEKSRVLLGKIIISPVNLLLLDEPTHHLDIESIEALIDAIEDFPGTVVIVTHSELILRRLRLDKLLVCRERSQSLFLGTYDEFLESGGWQEQAGGRGEIASDRNKYSEKRERAEKVQQRSKALKPINKEIEKIEKEITQLEVEQQKDVDALNGAAPHGAKTLALSLSARKRTLDALYDALDLAITKREELEF